jgi:excisionase family DNA binding protein
VIAMQPANEYLTVNDASNRFKVPPSRIYRWIEEGRIKEYKPKYGQRPIYVKIVEVQEVLDSYNQIVPAEEEDK